MMHKINIGDKIFFLSDNSTYYLEINDNSNINITVNQNIHAKLLIIGIKDYSLNITLLNNSYLTINSLNKDNNTNILINLEENAYLLYNHSTVANTDSINRFKIIHNKSNSTSILNNNGINRLNNKLFFQIDGIIPKNLVNISCNQNSKIINFDNGYSKVIPNLIIDSNDIIANHSSYIGEINENELFYLKSRGININNIKKLYFKGILLNKMELDKEEEKVNQIVNEWW